MRWACWRRLVTRMIVISFLSSRRISSMRMVVTGSMAMENSSRQRISGRWERAGAGGRGCRVGVGGGAGEGEALLLAAGELGAEGVEAVLDLVPEHGLAEAFFDEG